MDVFLDQILDRALDDSKKEIADDILDEIVDDAIDKASGGDEPPRKRKGKKKDRRKDVYADRTCCDIPVCSPPSSLSMGWPDIREWNDPADWVLDERARALRTAYERRRLVMRLLQCKHWRTLHNMCGCSRQKKNQWRAWDMHSHYCPKIGVGRFLKDEVEDDSIHMEEMFKYHQQQINEAKWPSALDLQCKRGRPSGVDLGVPYAQYSSTSSSEFSVSVHPFDYSLESTSSSSCSGSSETIVRDIMNDILAGLRDAPSSDDDSVHWGDTGDYDERNMAPWENDPEPEPVPEPYKDEDLVSDDIIEVGFVPAFVARPDIQEYYGPGPDGTRARPDPPPPGTPFDHSRDDDVLMLEF